MLFQSKFCELFGGPCAKVKSTIYAEIEASSSNLRWEEHFAKELIENPKYVQEYSLVASC